MKDKNTRVQFRYSQQKKERLKLVLDDINRNRKPTDKKMTVKDIVEDFITKYYKTNPIGLLVEVEDLEERINEIDEKIQNLTDEKNELKALLDFKKSLLKEDLKEEKEQKETTILNNCINEVKKKLKFNENQGNPISKNEIIEAVAKKNGIDYITLKKEFL